MRKLMTVSAVLFAALLIAVPADAQRSKRKKRKGKNEAAAPDKDKDIKELTKNCKVYDGLFKVYQDTLTGKSFLALSEEQLEQEYIYFSQVEDGVLDAGFFRGSYRGSKIIRFHKHYENIEVLAENTSYYYDENNALSKAKNANINTPILASEKIEAHNDSLYIISGDALFLSEKFQMVKPPSNPRFPGLLGGLNGSKSKVKLVNNYPENTEISVQYVYDNPSPRRGGSAAVTDVRNISVTYRHSILAMPENDYEPRRDDPRIGFFMTQVDDMTSFEATPYRDMIHRWNLVKKNPGAALSEPVTPITWWIENTTPEEFRPIIKEGVERWNEAFELAGFKNAVVVKVQPDDADWDAGDIRYNVLRWTSSPRPPFGGYGPSFVNPRTGEILGADIMLEFSSISKRLFREQVFASVGLQGGESELSKEDIIADMHRCDIGIGMQHNLLFGRSAMRAMNMDKAAEKDFVKQTLYRLVLHEVGHTLGMMHNMHGSTMLSMEQIKDPAYVAKNGLCNSVMEYPAINFQQNPEEQSLYYDTSPGPYDKWVIEYGYSESLADPVAEEKRLESILSRSSDPILAFGNDADDMRGAGKGMNPDVNIYDLSNDPVAYGIERCEFVDALMPKLMDNYTADGEDFHELRQAFLILTGEKATQAAIMTRQIGGVRYDRSMKGDTENQPLEPVSEADQKKAMEALDRFVFSPSALQAPEEIFNYLLPQRRGFNHFVNTDDPKLQERYMMIQSNCLSHLLHPNTTQRIVNSQNYGNTYELDEMMQDLSNSIFKSDLNSSVSITRQNLQIMYVKRLISMVKPKSKHIYAAQSMAWYELRRIDKMMNSSAGDTQTKAHRAYIKQLIDQAEEMDLLGK